MWVNDWREKWEGAHRAVWF